VVLRDASQNITVNRINQGLLTTTASGGTTTLTAASAFNQALVGTGGHTYRLPDATTLSDTTTFQFNNNATGTLTIQNNAGTAVGTIASGGAAGIALLSNATVGGTWDVHAYIPENVTWGTNALALGSTVITGGTWNGGTIATAYGGTGLTSYTSGGAVYANSSTTLTSGTLPTSAGGTGNTTGQAASTASSATFNSGGAGGASGSTFNGSGALTVSYNTIGAPSVSGTNATGTWGISISGNAATATSATSATNATNATNLTGGTLSSSGGTVTGGIGISGSYTTYSGQALTIGSDASYAYIQSWGSRTLWLNPQGNSIIAGTGASPVLTSANYNSYAPTLTGTGATGTWAINITGSAGTAGSVDYANLTNKGGGTGSYITSGDYRAPIFYDSDNTSTYINPNGASIISSGGAYPIQFTSTQRYIARFYNSSATGAGWWLANDSSTLVFHADSVGDVASINSSGVFTATNSFRAPIFYDSDNTAYYVDPNNSTISAVFAGPVVAAGGLQSATSGYTSPYNIFTLSNTYNGGTYYGIKYVEGNPDTIQFIGNSTAGLTVGMDVGDTTASSSLRAPIFYDSNNTAYYGDFASSSNLNLLTVTGIAANGYGASSTNPAGRMIPNGAAGSFNGFPTGAIKIRLPVRASDTMWRMTVKIYNYDSNSISEYSIGSYSYSTGAYNYGAYFTGSGNSTPRDVRVGNDGSYDCVWIGETSSTWGYPVVAVTDFVSGYSSATSSVWNTNWDISIVTSFTGSQSLVTPNTKFNAVTATSAMYAPIYYDSNDTNFYVDPASTSVMQVGRFRKNQTAGDYTTAALWTESFGNTATGIAFHISGNVGRFLEMRTNGLLYWNGTMVADTDFRAPIFYDSNNTAYYVDPASTSNLVGLTVANTISGTISSVSATTSTGIQTNYVAGINTTTPGQTTYGIAFSGSSSTDNAQGITWGWSGTAAQAGIYVQSSGSYGTKMYFGTTDSFATGSKTSMSIDHVGTIQVPRGYLQSDSSLRAPIFYDSNNTGYYLDPASTSNLNQVNLQGYLRRNTSAAGYLEGNYGTSTDGNSSSCIYTIGGAYQPGTTSLGNMYGCGFTVGNGTANPGLGQTGWGLYVAAGGTSRIFLDSDNGVGQATNSWRASIFYDRDNTSYYLDTTSLTSLRTVGDWRSDSSTWSGEFPGKMQYHSNNWYLQYAGSMLFRNPSGANVMDCNTSGDLTVSSSSRAPIFYDSNNTGYYLDPNGTSEINKTYYNANQVSRNYGIGQIGLYASTRFQAVFSMGEAYILPADGTTAGNLYGIAWSYPSAGGVAANLNTHGALFLENGAFMAAVSGSIRCRDDMRAPIFYDQNNTAYYVNPNSDSRLSSVYANDYFRAQGSTGLYLQDYAYYFDRNPDVYGNWRCGVNPQNSYVGISYAYSSSRVTTMFDSGGNGGLYNYSYWIYYWLASNACLGVRTSTTSSSYAMYVEGGIYSTGNIVAYSDVRKKREIVTVDNALATVNKLRGVFYKRIETNDEKVDPNKRQIGVIAQEVNEVLPEAVTYAKDVDEYGVQYGNMAGLFIEAIKELTAKIDALEQRITA
jgi:hypothetical protein